MLMESEQFRACQVIVAHRFRLCSQRCADTFAGAVVVAAATTWFFFGSQKTENRERNIIHTGAVCECHV